MESQKDNDTRLVGGDELFFHKSVLRFFNKVLREWENPGKPVALFLGCSLHKPYSNSFMHKKVIGLLGNLQIPDLTQQYIVGEPLAICPREMENVYPAAHYDFPPNEMSEKGRETFVLRLSRFIRKNKDAHDHYVTFAPRHHSDILQEAAYNMIELNYVPYNMYKLPELKTTLLKLTR